MPHRLSDMSDQRLKHLEFLQGLVARMATNSMAAKGWSVGMTTALIALAAADKSNPRFILLAVFPVLVFWVVDGYYMYLERGYRDRFEAVSGTPDENWQGFEMSALTATRSYFADGLLRPAVWGVHLLILALALAAWSLVK
jgi:hypothetical protein